MRAFDRDKSQLVLLAGSYRAIPTHPVLEEDIVACVRIRKICHFVDMMINMFDVI